MSSASRTVGVAIGAAVLVVALVAAWAVGRATAPQSGVGEGAGGASAGGSPIRLRSGIPIGVQRTRAGALAASDNYVATINETLYAEPARYERLVRTAYAPGYQQRALREGESFREVVASTERQPADGRLTAVLARRLDSFDGRRASTTTWYVGMSWRPSRTGSTWSMVETDLRWDGQRWLVERIDDAGRDAPAPDVTNVDDSERSVENDTFRRELRGMTAPRYTP